MRRKIIDYIKKKYKAEPEHLWRSYPDYIVFRHSDNNKWFGIIMDVSRDKLGLDGDDRVDIIDVKVGDPFLRDMLIQQPGYLPAYIFNDVNRIEFFDDTHSEDEDRYYTIGKVGDVMFVVYTERGEVLRLISARFATKAEEEMYYGNS